jgi:3-hydroxyacyl-CoA dehydrogenase
MLIQYTGTHMVKAIQRAAVLGAGVMGSRIAAHLANAGIPVELLDIVPPGAESDPKARMKVVNAGLESAVKSRPAAFFVPGAAALIRTGNFDDHLDRVAEADWIIEAVAEKLEIKRSLLARVDQLRRAGSLVTTNTSGLPVRMIAEGRSEDFRRHWLGTHFFNPPRYLQLVEVIPGPDTLPEAVDFLGDFLDRRLGKGVVVAKDAPNFIANRIGTFSLVNILRVMEADGYTIEEVDALTGPAMGLPRTATFRLLDLVGLDTTANVIRNLYENAQDDERREWFRVPPFMEEMLKRGWIGDKAGQGFFKKVKGPGGEKETLTLDLARMEYVERKKARFPILDMAKNVDDPRERARMLFASPDRAGQFAWKTMSESFAYAANRIPEICDRVVEVDRCVKWGFAWETGLFELWDALGVRSVVERIKKEGRAIPANVEKMLASGGESFYKKVEGRTKYFDFARGVYQPLERASGVIVLKEEKERERVIQKNAGASLIDLGDGVFCVEFHTKMNAIGQDIFAMIQAGLKETAANGAGLVIGNQAANFSVGANLMMALMAVQADEWDELDLAIRQFQNVNLAIKYSTHPVVVAPFGMSLGGGCEIPLHAPRIRASAELYMGMVETGVGLIPAGGGCKEMVIRAQQDLAPDEDPFARLKQYFEQIGMAKVSTSAEEARRFHYLRPVDQISMNRDRLIADAKNDALELARGGYRPPARQDKILALGEEARATLMLGVHIGRRAEYFSDHDALVGRKLAHILAGGALSGRQEVSEQYLLDLEREAFLSLLGENKTQERMAHTLKTGKPLRN